VIPDGSSQGSSETDLLLDDLVLSSLRGVYVSQSSTTGASEVNDQNVRPGSNSGWSQ